MQDQPLDWVFGGTICFPSSPPAQPLPGGREPVGSAALAMPRPPLSGRTLPPGPKLLAAFRGKKTSNNEKKVKLSVQKAVSGKKNRPRKVLSWVATTSLTS